jgi:molybdenum cofactor cytidylyltransferase
MKPSCAGILLAAGQGTRFGTNKLLHPLADGTPMAVACARTLRSVLSHCIAVVDDAHSAVAGCLAEAGRRSSSIRTHARVWARALPAAWRQAPRPAAGSLRWPICRGYRPAS